MSKLSLFVNDSRGSTLAEVLVYVALLGSITSILGASFFHATETQRTVESDGYALNELRRGLGWFVEDVAMAREASSSGDELTLMWTDYYLDAGTEHSVTYGRVGDALVRSHFVESILQSQHEVARRVASASFTVASRTVSASLTVDAADGANMTMSMNAVMKPVLP